MAASKKVASSVQSSLPRFYGYSEEALLKIFDEKDSANTVQDTKTAVRIFEHFLVERYWKWPGPGHAGR